MQKYLIIYDTKQYKRVETYITGSTPQIAIDRLKARLKAAGEIFVGCFPPIPC